MTRIFIAALACVLCATATFATDMNTPQALVARFLSLAKSDRDAAAAMLDPKAFVIVGHVGFPMTPETLQAEIGCVLQNGPEVGQPFETPGRQIFTVLSNWLCPLEVSPDGKPVKVTYIVEGDHILGTYLEFAYETVP